MADALDAKKISAFVDNAAPADTDYFLNATGNVMKKTKQIQMILYTLIVYHIFSQSTRVEQDFFLIKSGPFFSPLLYQLSFGR